jgi:hypothetical protein
MGNVYQHEKDDTEVVNSKEFGMDMLLVSKNFTSTPWSSSEIMRPPWLTLAAASLGSFGALFCGLKAMPAPNEGSSTTELGPAISSEALLSTYSN